MYFLLIVLNYQTRIVSGGALNSTQPTRPVQLIAWKDSSPKWPITCCGM